MSEIPSWWQSMRSTPDTASCRETARLLQSYLDGHVDSLTHRRISKHLEMCRRCGMEAQTYLQIKAVLARHFDINAEIETLARLREFGAALIDNDSNPRGAAEAP